MARNLPRRLLLCLGLVTLFFTASVSPAAADHYGNSWCRDDESLRECLTRLAVECATVSPECVVTEAAVDCTRRISGTSRGHCPVPEE
jgi:hypothetical protein